MCPLITQTGVQGNLCGDHVSSQSRQGDNHRRGKEEPDFCSFLLFLDGQWVYPVGHTDSEIPLLSFLTLQAWVKGQVSRTNIKCLGRKNTVLCGRCSQESASEVVWPMCSDLRRLRNSCVSLLKGRSRGSSWSLEWKPLLSQEQEKRVQFCLSVWMEQGKFGFILGSHACYTQNITKVKFFFNTQSVL